jgi:hypothetical protein
MQTTIARAKDIPILEKAATKVEEVVNKLAEVAIHMGTTAMGPKVLAAFANAIRSRMPPVTPFLHGCCCGAP